MLLYAITYLLVRGTGIWGINAGRVGLRSLTSSGGSARPRGNADLRHPSAAAPGMAHLHQPLRRGRPCSRWPRGPVPAHPCTAVPPTAAAHPNTMQLWLQFQPAGVGRVRGFDLRHRRCCSGTSASLTWPHARPAHAAGRIVYAPGPGLAGLGPALVPLPDGLPAAGRPGHAAGGSVHTVVSSISRFRSRLATRSSPTSWPGPSIRFAMGADAGHSAPVLRLKISSPCGTSTTKIMLATGPIVAYGI